MNWDIEEDMFEIGKVQSADEKARLMEICAWFQSRVDYIGTVEYIEDDGIKFQYDQYLGCSEYETKYMLVPTDIFYSDADLYQWKKDYIKEEKRLEKEARLERERQRQSQIKKNELLELKRLQKKYKE